MSGDLHWRNTQKTARFFNLDARSAIFLMLFLIHMSMWTLILAVISMVAFYVLERAGLGFTPAIRAIRCYFLGPWRPANHRRARRRRVDYEAIVN